MFAAVAFMEERNHEDGRLRNPETDFSQHQQYPRSIVDT